MKKPAKKPAVKAKPKLPSPPKYGTRVLTSPGPFYAGGGIWYIDKSGKVQDGESMPPKGKVMTDMEFFKKYGVKV